jgi:transforming growth factor-beta-induced protein
MKRWMKFLSIIGAALSIVACGGGDSVPAAVPGNIVAVAQSKSFNALAAAVTKAGLVSALSDPTANLTVFAPTDAAFGTLATQLGFTDATALVNALPAADLSKILTYHVLPTKKTAADLTAGGATQATLYAFSGSPTRLSLTTTAGVTINDAAQTQAKVITTDVAASNGVIHAIDKVLVPPGVLNIVQMAQVNPLFTTLVSSVVKANLQATLSGAGPFTVFAPTNDAFAAIQSTVAGLTTAQLIKVLTYHVLPAQVLAANIPFGTPVATVEGETLTINSGTPPTITDKTSTNASIVITDVRASNGVIHVINKVLIPTL